MKKIILLIGSNLGNREYLIDEACNEIRRYIGDVIMSTDVVETMAWPDLSAPSYLNQILVTSTSLTPGAVMRNIMTIERKMGRTRYQKFAPRTIDIDILKWGEDQYDTAILKVPHPAIGEREYVDILLEKLDYADL